MTNQDNVIDFQSAEWSHGKSLEQRAKHAAERPGQ